MPKEGKKKAKRRNNRSESQWPAEIRMSHSIGELAVYLRASRLAYEELESQLPKQVREDLNQHMEQIGKRLKIMYRILEKNFEDVPKGAVQ